MLLKNGTVLQGKKFVTADLSFEDNITAVGTLPGSADFDASGLYVLPGLVDIHTHGARGEDFSDGDAEKLETLSKFYAENGVTSYLGTTMTLKEPELTRAMHAIRDHRQPGAVCAGVHLEGPFLSYAKRGAQAAENLHKPDIDLLHRLQDASGGMVKMVTVACEEEGAMDFIEKAAQELTVSLGHSTADYDTAMEGFRRGASHATHLFNGMPPLHHREPGIIGAAMDAGASAELICDGLHIHPSAVRVAKAMFGEKLNLISDSLRCAGMPDGDYTLGGQPIVVKNGKATLLDGTLAGSSISLSEGVRRAVKFGFALEDAVYDASTAPARAVKLTDRGSLDAGKRADILVMDKDLNIRAVFISGKRYL